MTIREEVDALLEAPGEPGERKRQAAAKSLYARGARPFGDPALFSKTMPEMSDADWAARKKSDRERAEWWEREKAAMRGEAQEKYVIWVKEKGEWVEQGDGELSKKTCERIVGELRREVGGAYKILPAGVTP